MGFPSLFLHMFFIIITIQRSHILVADASLADYFKCHSKLQTNLVEESDYGNHKQIHEVSGEDDNEERETLIVQKLRALLGLERPRRGMLLPGEILSPAPSPSPTITIGTEALSPAPARPPISLLQIRRHPHSPLHRSSEFLKMRRDRGRYRRILVAALVSTGAAFITSALGLIWVSRKFRKKKRISARTMSVYSKKETTRGNSKYASSQMSASKVSNPGIDVLYGLEKDLGQHSTCLKQTPEAVDTPLKEELVVKAEFDNASSPSSTREIMSVHGDLESVKCDSDGRNCLQDKAEDHSSDDESFHSFVDSCSSNFRLSNASAGSVSDTLEIASSKSPPTCPENLDIPQSIIKQNLQPEAPQSPDNVRKTCQQVPSPSSCLPLHFTPSIAKIASGASSSSSFPNSSSPRKSDSSLSPKQTPKKDFLSSPRLSSSITRPPCPPPFEKGNTRNSTEDPPPPPCPPPFSKANNSSTKGPPPAPSQLPQYSPVGKDGAPLPKLKPLYWDKVRAAPDRSMVWDKIRTSSFEFDEEMMESLFGYNLQSTMKNDEAKSKSPSPSKHVLEPKRLQNLTILSKALNATPEQVCEALITGEGLNLQQLEALAKMVPTKEEEAKLADYRGNINELGLAEKFVKLALPIPFAFLRVEAMLYRETFEDEVVHLRNSFSMLEEACKELRSSRLFLKLLEAVLKTGNRMNVGTVRGGARAFKLDALLKLSDVKGTDGKTTLLHFVVQEMIRSEGVRVSDSIMGRINQKSKSKTTEDREEDYRRMGLDLVSGLITELYNVKKTAAIDLDVLANSVSNLSNGMAKLQNLVFKDLSTDEKSGNFVDSMGTFIKYAERNLKELQENENTVLLHVREVTEYFHGTVSKEEANPLRIFVIVRDFLAMLDHVCKELRTLKVPNSSNPLAPFR